VEAAAKLAAYYSKGKESSKVSVDYIAVKHLRRIKGGRAGQVTFTGQSTISVSPESPEGLLGSSANSSRDREAEEEAV
jgi:predicted ribosome quality control (RQC) complex YloA/Tae2 family protein